MRITVELSHGIQCVLKELPATVVVERSEPATIGRIAKEIGVPPILIAFAIENGEKRNLDAVLSGDAEIYLFAPLAGG